MIERHQRNFFFTIAVSQHVRLGVYEVSALPPPCNRIRVIVLWRYRYFCRCALADVEQHV